ncbi:uncharacterized protein J3D65DRAFT_601072 [Phyllosticta citribraziliensis]|uniref:Uncharacterized protein n=1 Tax=Phyllosticta citribraziliensis TaxID=989973 RepID=A0ABR1M3P1_9PEZI
MPQSGPSGSGGDLVGGNRGQDVSSRSCQAPRSIPACCLGIISLSLAPEALSKHICWPLDMGARVRARAAYSASEMSSPLEHRLAHEETSSVAQQKPTVDRDSTARTDQCQRQAVSGSRRLRHSYASSTSSAGGSANSREGIKSAHSPGRRLSRSYFDCLKNPKLAHGHVPRPDPEMTMSSLGGALKCPVRCEAKCREGAISDLTRLQMNNREGLRKPLYDLRENGVC